MDKLPSVRHSFRTIFLLEFAIIIIKSLPIGFILNLIGKTLFGILHEEFLPLVKRIVFSPELYEDTLIFMVVMIIFSLPNVYLSSLDYYESSKNHG